MHAIKKIVILGGHGDGLEVLACIQQLQQGGFAVRCEGFLNDNLSKADNILGMPILGKIKDWHTLPTDVVFIPALHKIKAMHQRSELIKNLKIQESRWHTLIHPTAIVAENASIGYGCYIGPYVTIQPNVRIGSFVSIRAGANISHDCHIASFSFVGSNCSLCGCSFLEEGAHLAPNSVLVDGCCVGAYAVVGAGTSVYTNVLPNTLVVGAPFRVIK